MLPNDTIEAVAHVIELAVAPVFLVTGVSSMLGVLTGRLARIIDRARTLQARLPLPDAAHQERVHDELHTLARRARIVNTAITLCTTCALLVCTVIALLFVGAFLGRQLTVSVAILFVAAMLALIGALVAFLREVRISTTTLRLGPH